MKYDYLSDGWVSTFGFGQFIVLGYNVEVEKYFF
jgi:hypothetical protein